MLCALSVSPDSRASSRADKSLDRGLSPVLAVDAVESPVSDDSIFAIICSKMLCALSLSPDDKASAREAKSSVSELILDVESVAVAVLSEAPASAGGGGGGP